MPVTLFLEKKKNKSEDKTPQIQRFFRCCCYFHAQKWDCEIMKCFSMKNNSNQLKKNLRAEGDHWRLAIKQTNKLNDLVDPCRGWKWIIISRQSPSYETTATTKACPALSWNEYHWIWAAGFLKTAAIKRREIGREREREIDKRKFGGKATSIAARLLVSSWANAAGDPAEA